MITFVLVSLRYTCVERDPSSWRFIRTSRNAILPSVSSSLVNFTRGWTLERQSLSIVFFSPLTYKTLSLPFLPTNEI